MYRMLKSYAPSMLTNGELYTSSKQFITPVQRELGTDDYIKRKIPLLEESQQRLKSSELNPDKRPYTLKLEQGNVDRNTSLDSFIDYIDGVCGLYLRPREQQAGLRLQAIVDQHGRNIDRLSYENETYRLAAMIQQMELPEAQIDIETLRIKDLFEDLRAKHLAFETILTEKMNVEAKVMYPRSSQARQDVSYHIGSILRHVDSEAFEKPEILTGLVNELNDGITYIMAKAHARRSGNGEPPQPPAPVQPAE